MNDTEYKPVLLNVEPVPVEQKSSFWDWFRFYWYNLKRKPEVRRKQAELERIVAGVKMDMAVELLPYLWQNRTVCNVCNDMYFMLKPQIFLSQIELVLKADPLHENSFRVKEFHVKHAGDFKKSEELSKWINGFV